ncbi:hypothetical protein L596_016433 [Steinernema carpocapsae]|uniref:SAM-dependent MTase TRM10-type domain-containing protein n=1 Tax=Steinernema carpocapsae TaxID=34508 RepID=A0A4U5NJ07_STECR|nr:hypothetical protein L596_016433 [Steinernema carpocapsae]
MVYGAGGYQLVQNPTRYRKSEDKQRCRKQDLQRSEVRSASNRFRPDRILSAEDSRPNGHVEASQGRYHRKLRIPADSADFVLRIGFWGLKRQGKVPQDVQPAHLVLRPSNDPSRGTHGACKRVKEGWKEGRLYHKQRKTNARRPFDVYVLAAVKDQGGVGFASSRLNEIPAYRLPIHRYVEWKSGTQTLPVNNIARILREVYSNGGDWSTALHKNISVDRLRSVEEKMEMRAKFVKSLQAKKRNFDELVAVIQEATKGL